MKRHALLIFFLSVFTSAYSQTEQYYFKPAWKVGEKKTIDFRLEEKEYEDGELIHDTTEYHQVQLQVIKEAKDAYIIKLLYQNVVLRSAQSFYDKMGEELKSYQTLELQYSVSKTTGKPQLMNWKQARDFMTESYTQITNLIKEKTPELAFSATMVLQPVMSAFETKETTEAFFVDEIGFIFFPFGKHFKSGDTLKVTESAPNPFSPTDSLEETTFTYLDKINKVNKTCSINSRRETDMTEYTDMIKTMIRKMLEGLKAEDNEISEKEKEIDQIRFDLQQLEIINFNYSTGWPLKVVKTSKVEVVDPESTKINTGTVSITIK